MKVQAKTASEKITVNTVYNDNKHSGYCVGLCDIFLYM